MPWPYIGRASSGAGQVPSGRCCATSQSSARATVCWCLPDLVRVPRPEEGQQDQAGAGRVGGDRPRVGTARVLAVGVEVVEAPAAGRGSGGPPASPGRARRPPPTPWSRRTSPRCAARTSFCRSTSGAGGTTFSSAGASRSARAGCAAGEPATGPRLGARVERRARDGHRRRCRTAEARAGSSARSAGQPATWRAGGAWRGRPRAAFAGQPWPPASASGSAGIARAMRPGCRRPARAASAWSASRSRGWSATRAEVGRRGRFNSGRRIGSGPPAAGATGSWRAWVTGAGVDGLLLRRGLGRGRRGHVEGDLGRLQGEARRWRWNLGQAADRPPAGGPARTAARCGGRPRTACSGIVGTSGSASSGTSAGAGAWRTSCGRTALSVAGGRPPSRRRAAARGRAGSGSSNSWAAWSTRMTSACSTTARARGTAPSDRKSRQWASRLRAKNRAAAALATTQPRPHQATRNTTASAQREQQRLPPEGRGGLPAAGVPGRRSCASCPVAASVTTRSTCTGMTHSGQADQQQPRRAAAGAYHEARKRRRAARRGWFVDMEVTPWRPRGPIFPGSPRPGSCRSSPCCTAP